MLGGRIRLRQPQDGLRATIDPVMLAAAVAARPDDRILELGCGTGVASFCLVRRLPACRLTGLELQPELAALARDNIALNDVSDRMAIVEGDLTSLPSILRAGSFDHVMANPPYAPAGAGTLSASPSKAIATSEAEASGIDLWVEAALTLVRPRGTVTMIHRADRLPHLLAAFQKTAGGIIVFPLWPAADKPARRIIVSGCRGSRAPLRLLPGLILHRADGGFTADADAVLRDAGALDLS